MKKRSKRRLFLLLGLLILILSVFLVKCTNNNKKIEETDGGEEVGYEYKKEDDKVEITTSKGKIVVELYPDAAPKAVENFVTHAANGYYDGIIFHRVMQDFMIQTGDPEGTGMGGESIWGVPFEDEFSEDHFHIRGALSMANTGHPSTNGSQFFIVQASDGTPWLDNKHTVFGQVVEGMDVVDAIAEVPVDGSAKPTEEIRIESMKIGD